MKCSIPDCAGYADHYNVFRCAEHQPKSLSPEEVFIPGGSENSLTAARHAYEAGKRHFRFNGLLYEITPTRCEVDCCDEYTTTPVGRYDDCVRPHPKVPSWNALPEDVKKHIEAKRAWHRAEHKASIARKLVDETYNAFLDLDGSIPKELLSLAADAHFVFAERDRAQLESLNCEVKTRPCGCCVHS